MNKLSKYHLYVTKLLNYHYSKTIGINFTILLEEDYGNPKRLKHDWLTSIKTQDTNLIDIIENGSYSMQYIGTNFFCISI